MGADDESITKVNSSVCSYGTCGQPATRMCPECGQDFCDTHECLMHSKALPTAREPIIDEDGITKRNSERIKLVGEGWPNHLRTLESMTDEETVEFIKSMQAMLKQAIEIGDYARISIAHAEYAMEYREHSRHVKAIRQREKHEAAKQGILNLGKRKLKTASGQTIPDDIASMMKAFGLSYEQAQAMKILLGGAKKP